MKSFLTKRKAYQTDFVDLETYTLEYLFKEKGCEIINKND